MLARWRCAPPRGDGRGRHGRNRCSACDGASSSRCSAARRRGRSRRGRSSASGCGASACSCLRGGRSAGTGRHGCVPAGAGNWAGPSAATCGSTLAGPRRCRRIRSVCGGIGRARARRHPGLGSLDRGAVAAGDPQRADRVRPVVADPVGAGFVESLARPGGNATGFIQFEYGIGREMAGAAQGDRAAA